MDRKKALFITESMTDLPGHLRLAERLREHLGIVFLVKERTVRSELWQRGFPSFAYTELLTESIAHLVEQWWEKNRVKPFESLAYQGLPLWKLLELERGLIAADGFGDAQRAAVKLWADPLPTRLLEGYEHDRAQDRRTLTAALLCRTVGLIESFSRLLRFVQPSAAFIWNGLFLPTSVCSELCVRHGIPAFFSEQGHFPNTMVVDPEGVDARSSLCGELWRTLSVEQPTAREIEQLGSFLEAHHQFVESRADQKKGSLRPPEVRQRLKIGDDRLILYAAQPDTDAGVVLASPAYSTNEKVIGDLARAAAVLPGARIVVSLHPQDACRAAAYAAALGDHGSIAKDILPDSLLAAADVVVVRNSAAGLEALTHRRAVVALGQPIYSGKGFTYDVRRSEELIPQLGAALRTGGLPEGSGQVLDRFLIHLTQHYLYRVADGECDCPANVAIEHEILRRIDEAVHAKRCEIVPAGHSHLVQLLKEQGPLLRRTGTLPRPLEALARKAAKWAPLSLAPDEIKQLCRLPQSVPEAKGR